MTTQLKVKTAKFFVICGGEGSGKSTVIRAIKERFPDITVTREPGGSPYAEHIRDVMFKDELAKDANSETMFGLFWAARADHMNRLVLPAIREGKTVVSDRFDCCTFAYQIHGQKAAHLEELFWQTRRQFLNEKTPDAYIFLDVDPEVGLTRVAGRPGKKNHFDERDMSFHHAVRNGYLDFFGKIEKLPEASSKVITIDAGGPLSSVVGGVINAIKTTIV